MKKKILTTVSGVVGLCALDHYMLLGVILIIVSITTFVEIIS